MKILHTGDWHVGRAIRGRSRADEHREVLEEIVELTRERAVDLVLIAGDLFETASPSAEAESIVYEALAGLVDTGARVVAVAGNHDSPHRLRAVAPLLERGLGVRVGAEILPPDEGGVVEVEAGGERARVALLPFLSQRRVVSAHALMTEALGDQALSYARAMGRLLDRLAGDLGDGVVRLLLGHLTIADSVPGGGERSAQVGEAWSVPARRLPTGLHYAALGHLHRPQEVPAGCPARYCGSILQLDFGERDDRKSVVLVEAGSGTPARVEVVPLAGGRRLRRIRGRLEALDGGRDEVGDDYLQVLLDESPRPGLADAVREIFPTAVDVRLVREAADGRPAGAEDHAFLERAPRELFSEYLAEAEVEADPLLPLFDELLERVS